VVEREEGGEGEERGERRRSVSIKVEVVLVWKCCWRGD
jgi:hypothetical protein